MPIILVIAAIVIATFAAKQKRQKNLKAIANLPELSPSLKYVNGTFAIITLVNGGHYAIFGGQHLTPESKKNSVKLLKDWWDIADLNTGMQTVTHLSEGMHNMLFINEVKTKGLDKMSEEEYNNALCSIKNKNEKLRFQLLRNAYLDFQDHAVSAWDLARANDVLSRMYLAGFIDRQSYIDHSLNIARQIQNTFHSWEDFYKSYLYGYQYWSGENPAKNNGNLHNYQARERAIQFMKDDPHSPYYLNWLTPLDLS